MQHIRSAARALIIQNNCVLFIKMKNNKGAFYILPGGGQLHGETLIETVKRECKEELGAKISVGNLYYTREYIGKNHTFNGSHRNFHQIEHVFNCSLTGESFDLDKGVSIDKNQVGIKWINIKDLESYYILPKLLKKMLKSNTNKLGNCYLGDIN